MSAAMSDALCLAVKAYSMAEHAGAAWYAAAGAAEHESAAAWARAEVAAIRAHSAALAAVDAMGKAAWAATDTT